MSGQTLLTRQVNGDRLQLTATGDWTANNAGELERLVGVICRDRPEAPKVEIDMGQVEKFDTFGAWLLERMVRDVAGHGRAAEVVGLPERFRGLAETLHEVGAPSPRAAKRDTNAITVTLATVGGNMAQLGRSLMLITQMFGAVTVAVLQVLRRPRIFRFTSMINQIDRVGWRAVPIIVLITFLIGAIVAQQGIFHFRRFGVDIFVVDMVGVLVLRELGVLTVCIMVAGRSGSAYTAELGSMKMREEIDALQTMGFDPVNMLILPRIIALVIAVPMLTFIGSMAALYGGGLVAWLYGNIPPEVFLQRLREAISTDHFLVGIIKAPFMALVIGIVACVEGLEVRGSAESLGLQTTSSVVKSIFLVIVLDGIFAVFFAAINM